MKFPFDRPVERAVISSWVEAVDSRPLNFVVALHAISTVVGGFDAHVCIFEDASFQLLCRWQVNARVNAALTFVVAMSDVPVCFELPTIIVREWNQEIRPAKTNEKQKNADQVFVRRPLRGIGHDSFHAATSKKLHPT